MRPAIGIVLAIAMAACLSAAFVIFTSPEGKSYIYSVTHAPANTQAPAKLDAPAKPDAQIFATLNVIDDSRSVLNALEQKELFNGLSDHVRDPISIQVRNLIHNDKDSVCGEMNTRNAFGGYVGFEPFVAVLVGNTAQVLIIERKLADANPQFVSDSFRKMNCL